MKIIAVTQRLVKNNAYHEIRDALDVRWAKLCSILGYTPILLPTYYDFKKYFKLLKINGVILTGGNDLSSFTSEALSKKRDAFEKELIKFAISNNTPILGVCRGMQIIADYFNCSFSKIHDHVNVHHKLDISSESKLVHYLRKIGPVNSYHNYAVESVTEGLIISARSSDGVIEAFEHEKYRIFAQMWHSERNNPFHKEELAVMNIFLKSNRAW